MKRLPVYLVGILFLYFSDITKSQDKRDEIFAKNDSAIAKNASLSEKQIFSDYFVGIADLFQNGNGALKIQFTPYGISHLRKSDSLDYSYSKHLLSHNIQFTLGAIPDTKNNLQIDNVISGFTWAIVNNKKASKKLYNTLLEKWGNTELIELAKESKLNSNLLDNSKNNKIPNKFRTVYSEIDAALLNLVNNHDSSGFSKIYTDSNYMDKNNNNGYSLIKNYSYKSLILMWAEIKSLKQLTEVGNSLNLYFNNHINRRPLITESFQYNYKFDPTQSILDSITWNQVLFGNNSKGSQFSVQSALAVSWANDTLQKNNNLGRDLFRSETGIDYKVCKTFEIKGVFNYTHIYQGLYKGEKTDSYAASLTPSYKFNSRFTLPITLIYEPNPKKAQFLGFLSIQYSLK